MTQAGLWFRSLSSSSTHGNAYLAGGPDGTVILIDCGVRLRRLERFLRESNVEPAALSGIFLTHEHVDHVAALDLQRPFTERHGVPAYAPAKFWARWTGPPDRDLCRYIEHGQTLAVGSLRVTAFRKPHDTVDPVSYVIAAGDERLGVVTDLGHVPPRLIEALHGINYLIFESNHDRDLELNSGRDPRLIRRVLGDTGHLSNDQAGRALAAIAGRNTMAILLAHLSIDCNTPQLAHRTVTRHLSRCGYSGVLAVAPAGAPSAPLGAGLSPREQIRIGYQEVDECGR